MVAVTATVAVVMEVAAMVVVEDVVIVVAVVIVVEKRPFMANHTCSRMVLLHHRPGFF